MNLVIDFGNSNVKIAMFDNFLCKYKNCFKNTSLSEVNKIKELKSVHNQLNNVIVSSVIDLPNEIISFLETSFEFCLFFSSETPTPLSNCYKSKSTLGYDRLAAAAGANFLFPDMNILIIDIGTAITYDIVEAPNKYKGGNISPGIDLRYKSLHQFTQKLPLIEKHDIWLKNNRFGRNTTEAIVNGVQTGILFEIEKYILDFRAKYKDAICLLTGGDMFFFVKNIKKHIFAEPNLVEIGLNCILNFNLKQQKQADE